MRGKESRLQRGAWHREGHLRPGVATPQATDEYLSVAHEDQGGTAGGERQVRG